MVIELIYLYSHLPQPLALSSVTISQLITRITSERIKNNTFVGVALSNVNTFTRTEIVKHGILIPANGPESRGYYAAIQLPALSNLVNQMISSG